MGAVNPRFGRFSYAFTLAVLVGVLTVGSLGAIFWSLAFQCEDTCTSIPVGVLHKKVDERHRLEKMRLVEQGDLKCYGFRTSDWVLETTPQRRASAIQNPDLNMYWYNSLGEFSWEAVASIVSKNSHLHHAAVNRQQWQSLLMTVLAYSNITRGRPAVWDHPIGNMTMAQSKAYTAAMIRFTNISDSVWAASGFGGPDVSQVAAKCNATLQAAMEQYLKRNNMSRAYLSDYIMPSVSWEMLPVRAVVFAAHTAVLQSSLTPSSVPFRTQQPYDTRVCEHHCGASGMKQ